MAGVSEREGNTNICKPMQPGSPLSKAKTVLETLPLLLGRGRRGRRARELPLCQQKIVVKLLSAERRRRNFLVTEVRDVYSSSLSRRAGWLTTR